MEESDKEREKAPKIEKEKGSKERKCERECLQMQWHHAICLSLRSHREGRLSSPSLSLFPITITSINHFKFIINIHFKLMPDITALHLHGKYDSLFLVDIVLSFLNA